MRDPQAKSVGPGTVSDYLQAAHRKNTERSYASAQRHFERAWGGLLPATPDSVAQYLAAYAGTLSVNTLKQRLAALAKWHQSHGFADPTKAPIVKQVLKGIQTVHPATEKRAEPLQLEQLAQIVAWLDQGIGQATARGDRGDATRHRRDKALVLLGFWRGFRGDELIHVEVRHLRLVTGEGMSCFLPQTKGDREGHGTTFRVPALSRYCPVEATAAWLDAAPLSEGPLFRKVDRWGQVPSTALHPNSLIRLLRHLFTQVGLTTPEAFSSHSLRRGFASWADTNGWDVTSLITYVGWKDVKSAMRYLDGADPASRERFERGLSATAAADTKAS